MVQALVFFLVLFCAFAGTGLIVVLVIDRSRRARQARLVKFTLNHPLAASEKARRRLLTEPNETRRAATGQWRLARVLGARLREAGLEMSPGGAAVTMVIMAAAGTTVSVVLGLAPLLLAAPVALAASYLAFNLFLDLLRSRRVKSFNEALPDCLDVLARGLRSGQPVPAALRVVADHASGIAEEEFSFCCEEMRLGVGLVEALGGVADRIGSKEARFIVIAAALQVETGGNLVETLENLANMLRERRKLRKKAAALSAEVRVSAFVLTALPFGVGLLIWITNAEYLQPLVADPRGLIMALAGLASLGMGIFSMYRLSRLDV